MLIFFSLYVCLERFSKTYGMFLSKEKQGEAIREGKRIKQIKTRKYEIACGERQSCVRERGRRQRREIEKERHLIPAVIPASRL